MNEIELSHRAELMARADLLPAAYVKKPANVFIALITAAELEVSWMTAMTDISVINGKPTMSAALMRTLVERAGHKFRYIESTSKSCTVEIIRCDDPEYPTRTTFTIEDAQQAGLLSNPSWKRYPAAMLSARATSACVRMACPSVLHGRSYVPEEMGAVVDDLGDPVDYIEAEVVPDEVPDDPVRVGELRAEIMTRARALTDTQRDRMREWKEQAGINIGTATIEQLEQTIAQFDWLEMQEADEADHGGTVEAPPVKTGEPKKRSSPKDRYIARQDDVAALVELSPVQLEEVLVSLHTDGNLTSTEEFGFKDWTAMLGYLNRIEDGARIAEDDAGTGWVLVEAVPT